MNIKNSTEQKFRGQHIDNQLKFVNHIMKLCLASDCYAIRVLANELNFGITKNVYFALSHIYAMAFVFGLLHTVFNRVF